MCVLGVYCEEILVIPIVRTPSSHRGKAAKPARFKASRKYDHMYDHIARRRVLPPGLVPYQRPRYPRTSFVPPPGLVPYQRPRLPRTSFLPPPPLPPCHQARRFLLPTPTHLKGPPVSRPSSNPPGSTQNLTPPPLSHGPVISEPLPSDPPPVDVKPLASSTSREACSSQVVSTAAVDDDDALLAASFADKATLDDFNLYLAKSKQNSARAWTGRRRSKSKEKKVENFFPQSCAKADSPVSLSPTEVMFALSNFITPIVTSSNSSHKPVDTVTCSDASHRAMPNQASANPVLFQDSAACSKSTSVARYTGQESIPKSGPRNSTHKKSSSEPGDFTSLDASSSVSSPTVIHRNQAPSKGNPLTQPHTSTSSEAATSNRSTNGQRDLTTPYDGIRPSKGKGHTKRMGQPISAFVPPLLPPKRESAPTKKSCKWTTPQSIGSRGNAANAGAKRSQFDSSNRLYESISSDDSFTLEGSHSSTEKRLVSVSTPSAVARSTSLTTLSPRAASLQLGGEVYVHSSALPAGTNSSASHHTVSAVITDLPVSVAVSPPSLTTADNVQNLSISEFQDDDKTASKNRETNQGQSQTNTIPSQKQMCIVNHRQSYSGQAKPTDPRTRRNQSSAQVKPSSQLQGNAEVPPAHPNAIGPTQKQIGTGTQSNVKQKLPNIDVGKETLTTSMPDRSISKHTHPSSIGTVDVTVLESFAHSYPLRPQIETVQGSPLRALKWHLYEPTKTSSEVKKQKLSAERNSSAPKRNNETRPFSSPEPASKHKVDKRYGVE